MNYQKLIINVDMIKRTNSSIKIDSDDDDNF